MKSVYQDEDETKHTYFNDLLPLKYRFDTCGAGELSTIVADTCGKLQDGMGRRVGDVLQNAFQFLLGFVAALYLSWQLTVVLLVSLPIIGTSGEVHSTDFLLYFTGY